ncbi:MULTISPECIES: DUF1456 family protein [unclassified Planococcus (in: firmicutes)]|uniref:DUF1456 family protein n=1 Tax=unclassified Planococcus (in: firmicutes) TaxID=2662419 RepID=UPI000C79B111|nr:MULTISPECIES: DUF1456 family protein [unclassified Planococcus (in: firmicutes)]PKG45972.1 DUF1456 domain-containing protein [Planococcus sp. Urea-trap-24]PKG89155.1 DUF1456 domain-containing protein [Planococcus sp. Urea-3u-39]PKH41672.1 DUF1456 domain-containing protein [Planococcus sp. MB-3u-09]
MDNNDILIRLRYALDLKNSDVKEIFALGGEKVDAVDVPLILTKTPEPDDEGAEANIPLANDQLERFLNGLITFNRGPKPGDSGPPEVSGEHINNLVLKKLRIALELTSEDLLDLWKLAGINVSKGELGAFLRKEGHKNYKELGDQLMRNLLKGITLNYRP